MRETLRSVKSITPLWVISFFFSLTEVMLVVGVINTKSGIQLAITIFALVFPVAVAVAFFIILWFKPYVFYPPTEYGEQTNVKQFVEAMQRHRGSAMAEVNKLPPEIEINEAVHDPTVWYNQAWISARRGERAKALMFLQRTVTLDESYKARLAHDRNFETYKDDPEFQKLLE